MRKLIRRTFYWGNIIAVVALLFAYLSTHISPARAWVFAFFGLAYPYLLLFNIGFVVFWYLRRKKIYWLSLVAIVLGFGYIGKYVRFGFSGSARHQSDLKLVSYNVRLFNYYLWEEGETLRDSILDFIQSQDAGIVCFQEFHTRPDRKKETEQYARAKLSNTPHYHINYANYSNKGIGLAVFSKYPIVRKGNVLFEGSANGAIFSDLLVNKDTIRVYNAHLQSIRLKKEDYSLMDSLLHINSERIDEMKDITGRMRYAYMKRAEQVNELANHMEQSPYPVLLCGDFNDTPISYSYKKLRRQMRDAFSDGGRGTGKTYRGRFPAYRIDYIFYSKTFFEALNYKTFDLNLSDHKPIGCEFRIKKKED